MEGSSRSRRLPSRNMADAGLSNRRHTQSSKPSRSGGPAPPHISLYAGVPPNSATSVAPHMLIHADRGDAIESTFVIDQDSLALGEDSVVSGVPRDAEPVGNPGDGEV
jgi:hypothetical protein